MSISVANASSLAYNEPVRSTSLFPGYVQENPQAKIVELIRHYYEYLNSKDNPSYELENLIRNHDIDEMSDKYLTAIQLQIAKSVPNSVVMDRRRLYKIIAQYYKTRGSEESIHAFFRIFFNEMVTIFYPSSQIFQSSTNQSESSTRFYLQDNDYWQKYSYEIRTTNDASIWKDSFLKFVHPAGLKLLIAVLVISFADNTWEGPISKFIENINAVNADEYWNNIKIEELIGRHSPKWQPNTLYEIDYLFKVIIDSAYGYRTHTYPIRGINENELYACVLRLFLELTLFSYGSSSSFRENYQGWLKYSDTSRISDGYAALTIDSASASYLPVNDARLEAVSTVLKPDDENFSDSYVDITDLGTQSGSDWVVSESSVYESPDISNGIIYTYANVTLFDSDAISNNEILITAVQPGLVGNQISLTIVDADEGDDELSLSIFENNIEVKVLEDSIASQVISILNTYASSLITAENAPGSDGSGLVTPLTGTVYLENGTESIDPYISMLRQHRPAYLPEADDILF